MEVSTLTKSPATTADLHEEETTRIRLAIKSPSGPPLLNETSVKAFFQRYSHHLQAALDSVIDGSALAETFWADKFINSSPAGLRTGTNDGQLAGAFDHIVSAYKKRGMKKIHLKDVDVTILDLNHAVARVAWSLYRNLCGRGDGDVEFEVNYFLRQMSGEEMRIFGWAETKQR